MDDDDGYEVYTLAESLYRAAQKEYQQADETSVKDYWQGQKDMARKLLILFAPDYGRDGMDYETLQATSQKRLKFRREDT
jgi:hypothetical protein